MTSISKNMCIDKLDDLVDKYNDTYSTIKVKPVGIKSKMYIDFIKENNEKDPKFKISDIVRMSKYLKKIAGYTPNWSEEAFIIKKVKNCAIDLHFFLIGIPSMQCWTATLGHGVTRKRCTKRSKHTGNLIRKNLQLKVVC